VRRWGLQRRIATTLVTAGLIVLGVVVAAAVALGGARTAQARVIDDYYAATITSNELFLILVDINGGVRSYASTGDPAGLQALQELQRSSGDDRLFALLADDPRSLAALEQASASTRTWFRDWAEPTMAAVQAGGPDAVTDAQMDRGRELFGQVRVDYDRYLGVLAEQRGAAVDSLLTRMDLLFLAVLVAALCALGAGALLWWALRRWMLDPVQQLAAETRAVRAGALEHEVTVNGPGEIAALGRDVEEMRQRIVEEVGIARAAREELARAHEHLEAQTAELERSNRELEQFAYVASHDLQEPLRKVASFSQMLQRRYAGQLDERADQYIEFAVDGAKRMQQLINDLLNFSRVGRLTAAQTDVDLGDCLDRALRNLDTAVEETGAQVTSDPLPVVRGEAPLLTQLLQNLIGNAIKFRSAEAPRIHVGARRDGDVWHLWCSDNGLGIEPQYADRVFVIFQRLHAKEVYAGTGIGLAICKKIVEYHGGTIAVDPQEEPGTTIRWTLPVTGAGSDGTSSRPVQLVGEDVTTAPAQVGGSASDGSLDD
jgi:signal transduction histidine kinase